jgi:hypothetical protein
MAVAFFFAYSEQTKPKPNAIIVVICVVIIAVGMMKLMAKVPSKKPEDKNDIL